MHNEFGFGTVVRYYDERLQQTLYGTVVFEDCYVVAVHWHDTSGEGREGHEGHLLLADARKELQILADEPTDGRYLHKHVRRRNKFEN